MFEANHINSHTVPQELFEKTVRTLVWLAALGLHKGISLHGDLSAGSDALLVWVGVLITALSYSHRKF